jgi:hypothetical protein
VIIRDANACCGDPSHCGGCEVLGEIQLATFRSSEPSANTELSIPAVHAAVAVFVLIVPVAEVAWKHFGAQS